jgi:hypothetical protein
MFSFPFLFSASLVPAGGSSRSGSVLVPFPVPLPSVFWWWLSSACSLKTSSIPSCGLCPVVVVACVVVLCSFPFLLCSFLRVVGWGWLGWLFYYQIQKLPVVSFTV